MIPVLYYTILSVPVFFLYCVGDHYRNLAEKACVELDASPTSASEASSAELIALRSQVSSMEVELAESFELTNACFTENTEYKNNVSAIEKVVMQMTGLFEDCEDLCVTAKTAVCVDDDLTALIEEVQSCPSPIDRVQRMYEFLKLQRNSLVAWINEVRYYSQCVG